MNRIERHEYTFIKNSLKRDSRIVNLEGSCRTLRIDGSSEYKQALHKLYTSYGYHPAAIRTDLVLFDENPRLIYLHGLRWYENGEYHPWTDLYTAAEKAAFAEALN